MNLFGFLFNISEYWLFLANKLGVLPKHSLLLLLFIFMGWSWLLYKPIMKLTIIICLASIKIETCKQTVVYTRENTLFICYCFTIVERIYRWFEVAWFGNSMLSTKYYRRVWIYNANTTISIENIGWYWLYRTSLCRCYVN